MAKSTYLILCKATISIAVLSYLVHHLHMAPPTLPPILLAKLLITAFSIVALAVMTMALRWHVLLKDTDEKTSYFILLKGYCIGMLFNLIAPGSIGGDGIRIAYSQITHQLKFKQAFGIVLQERLTGLLGVGTLFLLGAISQPHWQSLPYFSEHQHLIFAFFTILILITCSMTWIHKRWQSMQWHTFLIILMLSIVAQMGDITITYLTLKTLGYAISLKILFLIMPMVYVASVLPISIGGLGVREGTLATLLLLIQNIPFSLSICVGFLLYTAKLLMGILTGLPALLYSPLSWRRIKALYLKPQERS